MVEDSALASCAYTTTYTSDQHWYFFAGFVSACQYLLLSVQTIVAGIEATEVVPGRTEYIDLQQNFQVLVDSANTPGALNRLLEDVRMCGARKILLVFGCEGEEDKAKRPYMGEIAHYKVSPHSAQKYTSFVHILKGV